MKIENYLRPAATVVMSVAVFLFWWLGYPEALNYHEQNQLFLFTPGYFLGDICVPGGLADYIGEFIVQFYYVPWLGALLVGMLYGAMQWLMWRVVEKYDRGLFLLTFLLPVMMLWHQGDIDTLLSLPVAVTMALCMVVMVRRLGKAAPWVDIIAVPALYWLAGPVAWAYAVIRGLDGRLKLMAANVVVLYAAIMAAYWMVDWQYPLPMLFSGINYYRIPLHAPTMQNVVLLLPAVIAVAARFNPMKNEAGLKGMRRKLSITVQAALVAVTACLALNKGYDSYIYEMLWQDSMVRQERWHDIIQRAGKHQADVAFSSNCVNLALGMTGQLPDRMFMFRQSGTDALLLQSIRDNMSDLPTAEAFWRLGMVNSALRYMFDIQQSILNARKSGRCTKRIAECYIVNGNYAAADKHLELLRHTLFYRQWAEEATACLNNDAKVNRHAVWGKLRQYRYKERFLYYYPEKHKMLGLLFRQNTSNRLALDYFMGQLLLDGDFKSFMGYLQWVQQYGGRTSMPYGYADACQAIQQQGNVPGSAYAAYVNMMMNKTKK